MRRRVSIYIANEPDIDNLDQDISVNLSILQSTLTDESGRTEEIIGYDENEKIAIRTVFQYDERGNLTRGTDYGSEPGAAPDAENIREYYEDGKLYRDSSFLTGTLSMQTTYLYNADGSLREKHILNVSEGDDDYTESEFYTYLPLYPDCCTEISSYANDELYAVTSREWNTSQTPPFLEKETIQFTNIEEQSTTTCFFDPRQNENQISLMKYNWLNELILVRREIYEGELLIRSTECDADENEMALEENRYDEKKRVIYNRIIDKYRNQTIFKSYNADDSLDMELVIMNPPPGYSSVLQKWEYQDIPD